MTNQASWVDPNWPSFIQDRARSWGEKPVDRSVLNDFSGGMLHGRTMANRDCNGEGPAERIIMGKRRVAYPIKALCTWWASRVEVVAGKRPAKLEA